MGFLLFTKGGPVALPEPVQPLHIPSYAVTLTAYNAVPEQTDSDPFVTASGAYSNPQVVAARSRDLAEELPFGTIVSIEGPAEGKGCGYSVVRPLVGYRVIADTMNARFTKRVDVLFSDTANYKMADGSTKNAGVVFGVCEGAKVSVVGKIDITKPSNMPRTQAELAMIVSDVASALAIN